MNGHQYIKKEYCVTADTQKMEKDVLWLRIPPRRAGRHCAVMPQYIIAAAWIACAKAPSSLRRLRRNIKIPVYIRKAPPCRRGFVVSLILSSNRFFYIICAKAASASCFNYLFPKVIVELSCIRVNIFEILYLGRVFLGGIQNLIARIGILGIVYDRSVG